MCALTWQQEYHPVSTKPSEKWSRFLIPPDRCIKLNCNDIFVVRQTRDVRTTGRLYSQAEKCNLAPDNMTNECIHGLKGKQDQKVYI